MTPDAKKISNQFCGCQHYIMLRGIERLEQLPCRSPLSSSVFWLTGRSLQIVHNVLMEGQTGAMDETGGCHAEGSQIGRAGYD